MTLELHFFNLWAILVCFISNMIIGALWYSPLLFGSQWLTLMGKKKEDISGAEANKSMTLSMIPALIMSVLLALTLGYADASTLVDALVMGTLISVGFVGMSTLNLILFEGRSVPLSVLNVGYIFVSMNVAAVILTLWK